MAPAITEVELIEYTYPIEDIGYPDAPYAGFYSTIYVPGNTHNVSAYAIRIHTDTDYLGAYVTRFTAGRSQAEQLLEPLIGLNPLDRERIWTAAKRSLRQNDRFGLGPIDIALWDFAGKYYDAPIHELLGTYRERLPAYASTMHGQNEGGLDSPSAYADFAEQCLDLGYQGFKLHGFDEANEQDLYERDIAAIQAVGNRVGEEMDLMIDSSCKYETWAQALDVGNACDDAGFYWYEDPYSDAGASHKGHKELRDRLETPLLQGEMTRGVEEHTNLIMSGATDFVRVDPEYDEGITGAMKIAHAAESFGLDVEYHGAGPARRQCMAATRNANYYENVAVHPDCDNPSNNPAFLEYSDALEAVNDDGTLPVPTGPGLGIEIDWDYITNNQQHHITVD